MKKTTMITGAAFLLLSASLHAQTDTVPAAKQPVTTTTTETAKQDKYNNWSADTYKMQPMPDALTTEKIFPVIGKYELTSKEGIASTVTVSLDETNKGIVWIDGLPEGRIKATLRKSPSTYKIPAQKLGEEKDAKSVAEGVLIYDKDANVMNVCVGCTYNSEDPAVAFLPEPVVEEPVVKTTKSKTAKKKPVAKVAKIKPVHYTGAKIIEQTAATVAPVQQ
jgi:hypothetical protein